MKTLFVAGPANTAPGGYANSTASSTVYLMIAGQIAPYRFGYLPAATEGNWRTTVDADGNIGDLEVYISANTRTTATVFTLMKNGVSTGYSISVPAGATGWRTATGGPAAVVVSDLLSLRMVTGTGGGSITLDMIESTFTASSGQTVAHYFVGGDYGFSQGVSTSALSQNPNTLAEDNGFGTGWSNASAYANWSARAKLASTAISLRVDIPTNTTAVSTEIELFKNNVGTGLKITIGAAATGRFRATGSVAIAPGDILDIRYRNPVFGSGSLTIGNIQTGIVFGGDGFEVWSAIRSGSSVQNYAAATFRQAAPNPYIGADAANAWTRAKLYKGKAENLWVAAVISGVEAGSWPVCVLRINGVDTTLALTVPTTATGTFHVVNTTASVTLADGDNGWLAFRTNAFAQSPRSWGFTIKSDSAPALVIDGGTGAFNWTGKKPDVLIDQFVIGGTRAFNWTGKPGAVVIPSFVEGGTGAFDFTGREAFAFVGTSIFAGKASFDFAGGQPFVATEAFVASTQSALLMIGEVVPEARASQSAVIMIGEIIPDVRATQSAILVLVDAQPCVSRRADIWLIERRDGVRMAFTSHDRPIPFGDLTATPCGSMTPTAIEQSSELSGVGNMELQGLISSPKITEADLYAGLYDDAFVEVWRVSWDPQLPETPLRMAAGWWGNLNHGKEGFSAEVLGPGSRIQQQALVQMVTPGCRRDFGSPQGQLPPGGCGVNRDSYKVSGGVALATNRARFVAVLDGPGTAPQYANGLVRWLSGPNVDTACEVKSVDFATGEIILWSPTGFLPNEGDDFELLPGCDKLAETCKLYGNYINFGGFPDVPGTDAISETPDAKL